MGIKRGSEAGVLKACLQLLTLRGWLAWRNNSGSWQIPDSRRRAGYRTVRFGKVGSGDIFAVKDGLFLSLETKSGKNKTTTRQDEWAEQVHRAGGLAWVVWDVAELHALLDSL